MTFTVLSNASVRILWIRLTTIPLVHANKWSGKILPDLLDAEVGWSLGEEIKSSRRGSLRLLQWLHRIKLSEQGRIPSGARVTRNSGKKLPGGSLQTIGVRVKIWHVHFVCQLI